MIAPQDEKELLERQGLNWPTALALVVLHVGAIAALFVFSWKALTGHGEAVLDDDWPRNQAWGYHRLHTHRSFSIPLWMEYLFGLFGAMIVEGGSDVLGGHSPYPPPEIGPTRAIRILRTTELSGRTWAGFCSAKPSTTIRA